MVYYDTLSKDKMVDSYLFVTVNSVLLYVLESMHNF